MRRAVSVSNLSELPPEVLDELIAPAVRVRITAGTVTHWEQDAAPHLELVVEGTIRVFVTAPDGRTMTIRYCRPGALLGAMSLFSTEFSMPATTQALADVELLRFPPTTVRRAAERDVRVACVLLKELSERAQSFVHEISAGAFATVRQRVARHLLDVASEATASGGAGPSLEVRITQQELAASVGTAREVVVRVLRDLRDEGVVRTERGRMVIVDPNALAGHLDQPAP